MEKQFLKYSPQRLQQELEAKAGIKLDIKINDNHSTMLSVRWEPDKTRVSLHRMFLAAPQNVMECLAHYLKRKDKRLAPPVRFFIEENLKKLDYSSDIDQTKLSIQGSVYNLQEIYNSVNREYFDNKVNLAITWYGKRHQRNRSRITFGLYHDPLKLIKINRLMDNPLFPSYVIEYVVYHEMLHHVCPSYHDEKGIHRIHSKEFKQEEMKFRHYHLAQNWIKAHHSHLFKGMC